MTSIVNIWLCRLDQLLFSKHGHPSWKYSSFILMAFFNISSVRMLTILLISTRLVKFWFSYPKLNKVPIARIVFLLEQCKANITQSSVATDYLSPLPKSRWISMILKLVKYSFSSALNHLLHCTYQWNLSNYLHHTFSTFGIDLDVRW